MNTDDARARLKVLLAEIDGSAKVLEGENETDLTELNSFDQNPADSGSIVAEDQRQDAVLSVIGDQRAQVVEALARIEAGTFGACVDCGKKLSDERLDARPEAARCIEDQAKFEA